MLSLPLLFFADASLECAALSALWPVAARRDHLRFRLRTMSLTSSARLRRQAAAGQSADKAAHSKEALCRACLLCTNERISYYQINRNQGWAYGKPFCENY